MTMTTLLEPDVYTAIIDMGLIWRKTTPTTEDREKPDGTKFTWGDYAEKLVNFVLDRHQNTERIILVNDSYQQSHSIKDSERLLSQKTQSVKNVVVKSEDRFPSSRDFYSLLEKSENKSRLQAFIHSAFERI